VGASGAVVYVNGFVNATAGFYSDGTLTNTVNIPTGGVSAKTLSASGGSGFNDVQAATGGVFSHLPLVSDTGLTLRSFGSTPTFAPAAGYSSLVHKTGAAWWYYNAGWQTIDFSLFSANPNFNSVTIAGTWTLSNQGTGQLYLNGDMNMGNLVIRGTGNNSIQTSGAVLAQNGYRVGVTGFGIQVIDGSGNFVISPANFSGGATFGGGVQSVGFNITGGYFGQTTSFPDNNNITRYFRGGVLVQGP